MPNLGRWINRDPIEENGGINMYLITTNSTVINYDMLGKLKRHCPYCGQDSTSRLTDALNEAMK